MPYTQPDFRAIAEAWPDLERFYLSDEGSGDWNWAEQYADLESVIAWRTTALVSIALTFRWFFSTPPLPSPASWRTVILRHTSCINYLWSVSLVG